MGSEVFEHFIQCLLVQFGADFEAALRKVPCVLLCICPWAPLREHCSADVSRTTCIAFDLQNWEF